MSVDEPDREKVKLLTKRIDENLYYICDPINVSETPEARDGYEVYVPVLLPHTLAGSKDRVIDRIRTIETETMGPSHRVLEAEAMATRLLEWKRLIIDERR